jgi:hypothetical protein
LRSSSWAHGLAEAVERESGAWKSLGDRELNDAAQQQDSGITKEDKHGI